MAAIFYQSHQPGDSFTLPQVVHIDKLLHLLVYTVLGLAFLYALPPRWRQRRPLMAAATTVVFCFLFGVSDEAHQSFVPGRFADPADLVADTGGGLLAALFHLGQRWWQTCRRTG